MMLDNDGHKRTARKRASVAKMVFSKHTWKILRMVKLLLLQKATFTIKKSFLFVFWSQFDQKNVLEPQNLFGPYNEGDTAY